MNFSQDQLNAIDGICDTLQLHLISYTHKIAVLTGSAGTGKTTVIGEIIDRAKDINYMIPIALCASTHRAARVLADTVVLIGKDQTTTAHKLFKYSSFNF